MSYLINPYMVEAESCLLWSQTTGTLDNGQNTNSRGWSIGIDSGNVNIGKTLTQFSLWLYTNNASISQALVFGVWASANHTQTPSSAFTGSLTNNNQLSGSFVEYEFTGSHTLALNDRIGITWNGSLSYIIQNQIANGVSITPNTSFWIWINSSSAWHNYGTTNVQNTNAYQC